MIKKTYTYCLIITILFIFSGCGEKEIPRVPDWSKEAVWYQIFAERFANGDKNNDPTAHDLEGAWPHQIGTSYSHGKKLMDIISTGILE